MYIYTLTCILQIEEENKTKTLYRNLNYNARYILYILFKIQILSVIYIVQYKSVCFMFISQKNIQKLLFKNHIVGIDISSTTKTIIPKKYGPNPFSKCQQKMVVFVH